MKYWIIALPRERLELCASLGIFGLHRKFVLGHCSKGDPIVFYVSGEKKVAGFGEVTEPYYLDDQPVFGDGPLYPDRIGFKAELLPKAKQFDFEQFVPKLKFVKNPKYWSVHLNGSIAEITEPDWKLISQSR